MRTTRIPRRRPAVAALAVLALAGCGIQSMDVPVDAGPAPSKATCTPPEKSGEGTDVFLVCGSHVDAVERTVPLADSPDRVAVANALLAELQGGLPEAEQAAGFSSSVPPGLQAAGAATGDPAELLRLSRHPDDLPAFALVQIICTFSSSSLSADDNSVLLDGPPGVAESGEPHRYHCAESLLHRPDSARNAGSPP